MIKLHDYELSGNCYKPRLLMSLLGLPFERIPVNFFPGREHQGDAFLKINPLGQLPVLDDGDFRLRDAQAILVYLASRYDPTGQWFPDDPRTRGRVLSWLAVAEGITRSASAARLHDTFGYPADIAHCRAEAHRLFLMLDDALADGEIEDCHWLAADHPTVADLACFPYVALAPEGGIPLDDYPALRRWTRRVRGLPRFVGMSGIFALGIDPPPHVSTLPEDTP